MNLSISPNALDNLSHPELPDVLTVKQAQSALDIGRISIYNLIESGQLQAFRIGRAYKIPKKSLINFITERGQNT